LERRDEYMAALEEASVGRMALAAQGVDTADEQEQLKRMIKNLIEKAGFELGEEGA